MASLENYRAYIKQLLTEYSQYPYRYGEVESQTIFDTEHDHYQLVRVGWEKNQRIYGCVLHLDIKDGKIWIQWNSSDIDIGKELMALGVLKQDIVIGFQPEYLRQYSDYAVG
ncbi:MAG: XisI protein [Oculatellaceae cyanobacterium bins.114]|nr:XisI protein [Oculatellaceae cyanobacterium bins.114]